MGSIQMNLIEPNWHDNYCIIHFHEQKEIFDTYENNIIFLDIFCSNLLMFWMWKLKPWTNKRWKQS